MRFEAIDPSTGDQVARYDGLSDERAADAADAAHDAFAAWRRTRFAERSACLRAAAEILRAERAAHAERMAREMGKPLAQGRAEVDKCAWVLEHYAAEGEWMLADEAIRADAGIESFVTFKPLGVVLAIMPWNFPYWQVFRFAAPALMAGNAALLKHAPNVPGCALAIEDVVQRAGFPEGLFRTLLIDVEQTSALIEHRNVRAVTLTGSTRAGRAVAARAGAALKPTVLELGGNDPYVVLEDADVRAAARISAQSRLLNAGQSCIAAKRFVVVEPVADAFEEALREELARAVVGSPFEEGTVVGPLARRDLRDTLAGQVARSIAAGAACRLGGEVPAGAGFFYPPTLLSGVRPGMPAFDEELFGPVAAVVRAADETEALALANDSVYGLGAAIFTRDVVRGRRLAAEHLEAGCCFVNDFVRSDPRLPFGGIKGSGYGRELGTHGIRSFVNVKTVAVRLP